MDAIVGKLGALPEGKGVHNLTELIALAKGVQAKTDMPAYEKRKRCLALFETALGAGKPKLMYAAVEGLQLLLRDPTFNCDADAAKDEQRTSSQTLTALAALPQWDRQVQCQALSVVVQAISSPHLNVQLADVYAALQLCANAYAAGEEGSTRMAVRAALTQLLNSFCINRYAKCIGSQEIVVFMDMTALIKELIGKIDNGQQTDADELQLGLDALGSVVSVQPAHFHRHPPLLNVFTTELIPSVLCLLQASGEKQEKSKSFLGRSHKSQKATIFSSSDIAKSFYQLVEHLLKLMAPLEASRALTVEFFRSAMVVPLPEKRQEPLRLLKRFTSSSTLLSTLLQLMALDDAVWPIVIECVEEAAKQTTAREVAVDAIRTLQAMFDAFSSISLRPEQFAFEAAFFERVRTNNASQPPRSTTSVEDEDARPGHGAVVCTDECTAKVARTFVEALRALLPPWLTETCPVELDARIQRFAAEFVQALEEANPGEAQVVNCDAAYLCTYELLSMAVLGDVGRRAFLARMTCEGCVVYASDAWLCAVHHEMQERPLCVSLQLDGKSTLECVLEDFSGRHRQLLVFQPTKSETDESALPVIIEERVEKNEDMRQVDLWMHRLLSNCWGTVETVLGRFPLKADRKSDKFHCDGAEATLEAMRSFGGILRRCGMERETLWLFEKFAEEICNLEELRDFVGAGGEKKPWSVSRVDALGLDLLFEHALVSGTLNPGCWKHVVRAVEYVAELEKHQFALTKAAHTSYDGAGTEGLRDLLSQTGQRDLTLKTVGRVLDDLMLKIHALFEQAASKLNLPSLCALLDFVVAANENNLKYSDGRRFPEACNLLQRLSRLVVACASRPQVHLMRVWSTVSGHLAEAAGARFPEEVTRLAVAALSDCSRALLRDETPGFSFNHGLLRVFQSMLCSDACAEETQEHIVAILCAFIQERAHAIGSGWKPLFGAVKAIRIGSAAKPDAAPSVVHFAVLEVLKKYFELNDPKVFVPTALEFILCVTHYLQATAEAKSANADEASTGEARDAAIGETMFSFVVVAQRLLVDYFGSDELVASRPLLHRLRLRERATDSVDDAYGSGFDHLPPLATLLPAEARLGVFPSELNDQPKRVVDSFPWQKLSEAQQSLCELILTLIESLAGLVLTCTRQLQTRLIASLAEFIGAFPHGAIGPDMGAFCLCRLIFPIFQKWVRRERTHGFHLSPEAARSVKSLKQASGTLTQVVVEYVSGRPETSWSERLLQDCLHLLTEFVAHGSQAISGIGTACLRHLIQSTAHLFTDTLWHTTSIALWRANSITLLPVRRLCFHYFADSTDFGGDIGEVSVGIRKEDTDRDYSELQLVARQIFSLDEPPVTPGPTALRRSTAASVDTDSVPPTPHTPMSPQVQLPVRQPPYFLKLTRSEGAPVEVLSLEDLVTSLLSQQALIQLVSSVLLGHQSSVLANGTLSVHRQASVRGEGDQGFLGRAPTPAIGTLLHCLGASAAVAAQFDQRPSLKLLLQKLCHLEQSANLYKYAVAAVSVQLLAEYELARTQSEHLAVFFTSLQTLLDALGKFDEEAAGNKLACFARDRLEQRIQISLVENADKAVDGSKAFSVVSASKCLEEYKKQKRVDALPGKSRANPFMARLDSVPRGGSVSGERLQLCQLSDLDVRILAYSEVIALAVERFTADDDATFARLLPHLSPLVVEFLRVATNLRARNCIADFLARLSAISATADGRNGDKSTSKE